MVKNQYYYLSVAAFLMFQTLNAAPLTTSTGNTSPLCPAAKGTFFLNHLKDGTTAPGGFVANTAIVDDSKQKIYIGPQAAVCGDSIIHGEVVIEGEAKIQGGIISGHAVIKDRAVIGAGARINGNAEISEDANIFGSVSIADDAKVRGMAVIYNNNQSSGDKDQFLVSIFDHAVVEGEAEVSESATIFDQAKVTGNAVVKGNSFLGGDVVVQGSKELSNGTYISGIVSNETQIEPITPVDELNKTPPRNLAFEIKHLLQKNYQDRSSQTVFQAQDCLVRIENKIGNSKIIIEINYPEQTILDFITFIRPSNQAEPVLYHQEDLTLTALFAVQGGDVFMQLISPLDLNWQHYSTYQFQFLAAEAIQLLELSKQLQLQCSTYNLSGIQI